MKKNTFVVGLLALCSFPVCAQNLTVRLMADNPNVEVVANSRFDLDYGNVGNTSSDGTIIRVTGVDFGVDGKAFQATGMEYANGWGNEAGSVVMSAGDVFETSIPFNEVNFQLDEGYQGYELFAENMKSGEGFARPTGVQTVWLTFKNKSGNLRSLRFFADSLAVEGRQPRVCDQVGYAEKVYTIQATDLVAFENPNGAHLNDGQTNWGWTYNGFIANTSTEVNFGDGDYKQLVVYMAHDGERYNEYMEFYLDAVSPENCILRAWTGFSLKSYDTYKPAAFPFGKISGSHTLYVKWGDGTNVSKIELVKDSLWFENPMNSTVFDNEQATEFAVCYTTKNEVNLENGQIEWSIVCNPSDARGEGNNIGYTANGLVVEYKNIDFLDADYKQILIEHSSGSRFKNTNRAPYNFSLYVDLDSVDWTTINALENNQKVAAMQAALVGYQPIAVVPAEGESNWGTHHTTVADLYQLKGVHNLYVVYNLPEGTGANVFGVYLDPLKKIEPKPIPMADKVIPLMDYNRQVTLVANASFDMDYGNVGNTSSEGTIIRVDSVYFGDGVNCYQATGIEYANGWGNDLGSVRMTVGDVFEESVPFNEVHFQLDEGYQGYEMFAENMKDTAEFVRPTGMQTVWLTLKNKNGNLRSLTFYGNELANEGRQPRVSEREGYADQCLTIQPADLMAFENPNGAHLSDGDANWGWAYNGLVLCSNAEIDFGNADYRQLVAYIAHDGERYNEYMEFYIDAVSPENLVLRAWTGFHLKSWDNYKPAAYPLGEITGKHQLFVKFGDNTNLAKIELVKDSMWFENPMNSTVFDNFVPSQYAVCYTTKNEVDLGNGQIEWSIVCNPSGARGEGNNIGYTANGLVVEYKDIDFLDGSFNKVLIEHSSGNRFKNTIRTVNPASFALYVDLDNVDWSAIDGLEREVKIETLNEVLAEHEPIAVVPAEGEGDWGKHHVTMSALKTTTGVHNLYVVYNLAKDGNTGANIYGLYLDGLSVPSSIAPVSSSKSNEAIYDLAGRRVEKPVRGIYIQGGKKLLVK